MIIDPLQPTVEHHRDNRCECIMHIRGSGSDGDSCNEHGDERFHCDHRSPIRSRYPL